MSNSSNVWSEPKNYEWTLIFCIHKYIIAWKRVILLKIGGDTHKKSNKSKNTKPTKNLKDWYHTEKAIIKPLKWPFLYCLNLTKKRMQYVNGNKTSVRQTSQIMGFGFERQICVISIFLKKDMCSIRVYKFKKSNAKKQTTREKPMTSWVIKVTTKGSVRFSNLIFHSPWKDNYFKRETKWKNIGLMPIVVETNCVMTIFVGGKKLYWASWKIYKHSNFLLSYPDKTKDFRLKCLNPHVQSSKPNIFAVCKFF
jgi:hypothetical protein